VPDIIPIWAREGEHVQVHWRLRDGRVYVEEYTCPPTATTAAGQVPPSTPRPVPPEAEG
jgi:hypothetical protein